MTRSLACIAGAVLLCLVILMVSCSLGEEDFQPGTLTLHILNADAQEGKNFHYYISTFLPEERSPDSVGTGLKRAMDDQREFTGALAITDGEAHLTLKDPDNPGIPYVFKANNVLTVGGYIDVDDNTENHGGIDFELDDLLQGPGVGQINGNMVLNASYPDDFHISESGSAGITLFDTSHLMYWRYHQDVNDLGNVSTGVPQDYTILIENTGTALLSLEGTPYVQVSGETSAPFTVKTQPASPTIIPSNSISFVITIQAGFRRNRPVNGR